MNHEEYRRLAAAGTGSYRYEFNGYVALAHFGAVIYWRLYFAGAMVAAAERRSGADDAGATSFAIWAGVMAASHTKRASN